MLRSHVASSRRLACRHFGLQVEVMASSARTLVSLLPSTSADALRTKGKRNLQGATQVDLAMKRQMVFGPFKLEATTSDNRTLLEEVSVSFRIRERHRKCLENFVQFTSENSIPLDSPKVSTELSRTI